jgi:hypothetical protein
VSVSTCGGLIHGGAYIRGGAYSRRFTVSNTFDISTISNAESNGGIIILIASLGITNIRLIFKGHKSLEYCCFK